MSHNKKTRKGKKKDIFTFNKNVTYNNSTLEQYSLIALKDFCKSNSVTLKTNATKSLVVSEILKFITNSHSQTTNQEDSMNEDMDNENITQEQDPQSHNPVTDNGFIWLNEEGRLVDGEANGGITRIPSSLYQQLSNSEHETSSTTTTSVEASIPPPTTSNDSETEDDNIEDENIEDEGTSRGRLTFCWEVQIHLAELYSHHGNNWGAILGKLKEEGSKKWGLENLPSEEKKAKDKIRLFVGRLVAKFVTKHTPFKRRRFQNDKKLTKQQQRNKELAHNDNEIERSSQWTKVRMDLQRGVEKENNMNTQVTLTDDQIKERNRKAGEERREWRQNKLKRKIEHADDEKQFRKFIRGATCRLIRLLEDSDVTIDEIMATGSECMEGEVGGGEEEESCDDS